MKSRLKISETVMESLATSLAEALERGCLSWPLPEPPLIDSDLPVNHPKEAKDLAEKGLAMLHADKGMFDRHLAIVVDLIVPHRMNLMDDPFEVHERWLLKRIDKLTERMLFAIATEWLALALDSTYPDTERWWLAIALTDGLANKAYGQPVHQGYHLVESIALAQRPGTWHTQPEEGPQSMAWNPHEVVPRNTAVVAHERGTKAAVWLLKTLEEGDENRRLLLIEWCKLLLERNELFEPLGIGEILLRRANDNSEEVAARVVGCLARLIENDQAMGEKCATRLHERDELLVRRGMADVLTRLFRRLGEGAITLLESMLADDDESIRAVASATVGDLRFLDSEMWADKLLELCSHECPAVRRNLVICIRNYIAEFTTDERNIIPLMWADGDEVVLTRLREMLLRIEDTDPLAFSIKIQALQEHGIDHIWPPMDVRRPGRSKLWKAWLAGTGEMPEAPEQESMHISDMTVSEELPNLTDALAQLDDGMGFID